MEAVKEWCFCVNVVLILSVIFSLLIPEGSIGRFSKIVLAVFILISVAIPLGNMSIDFDVEDFSFEEQSVDNDEIYAQSIEKQIIMYLEENGFSGCIAECDVKTDNELIEINKVLISIQDSYDKDEVKNLIYKSFGIKAEVYYIGE